MTPRPKYITFDCYGTLTHMRMNDMAREMYANRIPAERMTACPRGARTPTCRKVLPGWRRRSRS